MMQWTHVHLQLTRFDAPGYTSAVVVSLSELNTCLAPVDPPAVLTAWGV